MVQMALPLFYKIEIDAIGSVWYLKGWGDLAGLTNPPWTFQTMVALLLATVALQTIIQASSLAFAAQPVKPADCLTSSTTITELVTCLDVFTVRSAYYTPTAYNAAQPTDTERTAWSSLITSLLKTDGDCKSSTIPESLEKIYKIQQFKDNLCVLFEQSSINGTYEKGWGTMIVPRSQKDVSRDIHFSAPHPGWERNTIQQAASLFNSTQSRSFLVPGRNHNASTELSTCIIGNGNFKTDVAINTVSILSQPPYLPYHDLNCFYHRRNHFSMPSSLSASGKRIMVDVQQHHALSFNSVVKPPLVAPLMRSS